VPTERLSFGSLTMLIDASNDLASDSTGIARCTQSLVE